MVLCFAIEATAWSQENPAERCEPGTGQRLGVLADHEFIPSSFIRDPFVRTFLHTGMGFGSTINRVAPPVEIAGKPLTGPKGDLLYALLEVEYQQALRSWLAVRGRLNVVGRMADETTTLIAQGVTVLYGFDLGWVVRIAETERLSVSGTLGLKNSASTDVYLQRFIEGIITNGEVTWWNKLVLTTPTLRGTAGVQGAYALTRLTGLTFSGWLDYGESMNRGEADKWYYAFSAAVDFNLRSNGGPPIGFVVGGKTGTGPDAQAVDDRSAQTIFGRIAYTGAEQFALGLDLGYQFVPIRELPKKQNFLSATVDMRLYF